MDAFTYRNGSLHAEDMPVADLAEAHGTPLYVYSRGHLKAQFRRLADAMSALGPLICYSVKANSNAAVLGTFAGLGAGFDVVSGGELFRALRAGADPAKIVFAGVGKTRAEIDYAIRQNILFFTVESEPEAERISAAAAAASAKARIAFRINPDVDPKTHKYISTGKSENKFGLDILRTHQACEHAARLPGIELCGIHMHIGSQILASQPFVDALRKIRDLCADLRKRHPAFRYIDVGGGIGIDYEPGQQALAPEDYSAALIPMLRETGLQAVMEPGRFLVGNAGILLCRVQYVKTNGEKTFVIADGAMNDLIRPSLYQAYHHVLPVRRAEGAVRGDLVGPICESGDFLARDRELPLLRQDDLVALRSAGAYGFAMSSNYNSRPRAAEVMVEGADARVVRDRETWEELVRGERPWQ